MTNEDHFMLRRGIFFSHREMNRILEDYEKGNDVDELKMIMYDYEDKELYLECEGIRLAIEYIEFLELIKEIIDD